MEYISDCTLIEVLKVQYTGNSAIIINTSKSAITMMSFGPNLGLFTVEGICFYLRHSNSVFLKRLVTRFIRTIRNGIAIIDEDMAFEMFRFIKPTV
jgi:hypothetical protein